MTQGRSIENFGGNVHWTPAKYYQPRTEQKLLSILEQHRGEQIRAMASLHSWSPVAATTGITIDLKALNSVRILPDQKSVWLGAGCTIQRALDQLRRQGGWTLPALGAIKKQTIAGAISTGTHGSGAPGMSHFVQAIRIARYCPETKDVVVDEIEDGEELRATRCALGCLGVVLEVRLPIRPVFLVEETLRVAPSLSSLLVRYSDNPLSFFVQAPYTDELVIWERREVSSVKMTFPRRLLAFLYRAHNFWGVDLGFHIIISVLTRLKLPAFKKFFRMFPRLLLLDKSVVDDGEHQLTLAHDLFRHEEMEVFIPEEHFQEALAFIGSVIKLFADEAAELSPQTEKQLDKEGLLGARVGSRTEPQCLYCRAETLNRR